MLVDTADLVREAADKGTAVGAFNVILLEQAQAYADAAVTRHWSSSGVYQTPPVAADWDASQC